ENSLDAVSDRDFVAEALFVAALTQTHLSRLGEEIVLWSSEEFGFVHLADAYSTGSSMLPQKKNPDIAELARGGAGRLIGDLTGVLATLKGLPLAYNRDLQGDKEPLFDALDTCTGALRALTGLLDSAEFDTTRMQAAADTAATAATDLAELLVRGGVPFCDPHGAVLGRARGRGLARARGGRARHRPGGARDDRSSPRTRGIGAARAGGGGPPADHTGRGGARARASSAGGRPHPSRGAAHLARARVSRTRPGRSPPRSFYARDPRDLAPDPLNQPLLADQPDFPRVAVPLLPG